MTSVRTASVPLESYSADEVAQAAGASIRQVEALIQAGHAESINGLLTQMDAVRLVRILTGRGHQHEHDRLPLTFGARPRRRTGLSLAASGTLHAAFVLLIGVVTSLGLLNANDTEELIRDPKPTRLVFLMTPGPGGGGGGGGLKMPAPPPRARVKIPVKKPKPVVSPVPRPVRRPPPPPRVLLRPVPRPPQTPEVPRIEPLHVAPPPPIQAPVMPLAADPMDIRGLTRQLPSSSVASLGPGTGAGVGSGTGTGAGEGKGPGLGPGSGGGTGGGPFKPGSGIEPPILLREIKPLYTDDARRRGIEGDVVLEIIVRSDGSVGNVRVMRSLGAGLDQRAVDAVRQWRFGAARRQGSPVDVVVEVSVEFKLR
jgi:TonB family protein